MVNYQAGGDTALVTGLNLTLSATGEWSFSASRPGDLLWDPAQTDSVIDGQNDIFKTVVGGPMRTIAVRDPLSPASSTPLVDMVTPAMVIADGDVGRIFGYDWVQEMAIVRWIRLQGVTSAMAPARSRCFSPVTLFWIKPKISYDSESIKQADIDSGLLNNGNPSVLLDASIDYRLLHTYSKAYPLAAGSTNKAPCSILMHAGWNQFGNIFFNYRKLAGLELTPKDDVGIPFSELKVKYLNQTLSLADAAAAGWIRDYAWRFDAAARQYVLVSASATGAERVLTAWNGYWIRTFVDCNLIIDPNTTYNGVAASSASVMSLDVAPRGEYDMPPPAP